MYGVKNTRTGAIRFYKSLRRAVIAADRVDNEFGGVICVILFPPKEAGK
jgi:hypothetical protein